MAVFITGTFYAGMAAAGYAIELIFGTTGLIPTQRNAKVIEAGITWNYTTWLNIAFLILAAALLYRFFRTGGRAMLTMMGGSPDTGHTGHGKHGAPEDHAGHSDHPGHANQDVRTGSPNG